jgi:hypothetical protein
MMLKSIAALLSIVGANAQLSIPDAPTSVALDVLSGSEVRVSFESPLSDGGSAVQSYSVEWDTDPGVQEVQAISTSTYTDANEIQVITTTAADQDEIQLVTTNTSVLYEIQTIETTCVGTLGGTFSVGLDTSSSGGSNEMSGEISFDADATGDYLSMKTILENMQNIGENNIIDVEVEVVDSSKNTKKWTITFSNKLGDIPELYLRVSSLTGTGADVQFATIRDQNLLGGSFRLSYQGYTTASIPHDATGGEVATALESLSTIDTVNVKRVGPTRHGGYNWTITFTSDYNGANLPELIPTYDDLEGEGSSAIVTTIQDGNELGGYFNVSYPNASSAMVPYDATPSIMKAAIENVGFGEVVVHRSGPDFELGYSWTVSFIELEGDVEFIELDITDMTGDEAYAETVETRKGTIKEVQTITTFGGADNYVNSSTKFFLKFRGEKTGVIEANPNETSYANGVCDATAREVQQIKTSTVDTYGAGGDDHVSSSLYFSLIFYTQDGDAQETSPIYANPEGGDCEVVATSIETELENLENLEEVTVTWSDTLDDESCTWRVTFDDQSGNLEPMALKVQGGANIGAAANGFWGDDTISLTTIRDGTVDAIKYELEQLTTIGTVTVDAGSYNGTATGGCVWRVTFESNTGTLEDNGALTPLTVASIAANGSAGAFGQTVTAWPDATDSISICADPSQCVNGTSVQLGGQFTLSFRGYRTLYMDHDVSARGMKEALESLPTIERVDVSRVGPDENEGYTWAVTFLTELGDVPPLYVDTQALTGTAPWSRTYERDIGVFPPFDSLDPENGLPLGSTSITSLDDLSITIPSLEQGIPYYFRVSALNANGQGPASLASPAFAVPLPQSATSPTGVSLSVVDGGALSVATMAPERDGGEEIDRYRVQYATQQFAQEVQAVRVTCDVDPEIQVIETSASDINEVQIIHAKLDDDYNGETVNEIQSVKCDAAYGSFKLSFDGETTADINVDDSAEEVQARLQELSRLNNVNVTFPQGYNTACRDCGSSPCDHSFNVTFYDVEGAVGDMPMLVPDVHGLYTSDSYGNRRVSVTEEVQGQAGLSGSFKLTFRGYTTVDISHNATSQEVLSALRQLDPIPYNNGVSVSRVPNVGYERMWRVTFEASEVGGNVESMLCYDHDMRLYGNGASLEIYSDGTESSYQRRDTNVSIAGNELGGSFTLTMLGHTTEDIDFNAADTQMKARLEALPNLGVVDVTRGSPSPEKGYAWTVTYVSNPGAFPVASSDVELLTYDLTKLSGEDVTANVTTSRKGYAPLGGTFQLRYTNGSAYRTTSEIAHNSDSSEVKAALEALDDMVGRVSVEKTINEDGYTWSITFGPCQTNPVTGEDVCNDGDLYLLELVSNATLEGCAKASVGVTEVIRGSGPDLCPLRESGYCYDDITDLSNGAPFAYEISMLDVGTPYYVRVAAHTDESFGTYAVSYPEFAVPSHLKPEPPPRVRLTSSTETTITVEWDHPTENGGSPVRGYELWMDDWEGGNLIKVYDGTSDSKTLSFTVDPDNAPHLESGRKYQFIVRAINLCRATDDDLACYSDFSEPAVFTVRAPRPPLAPGQPLRDSAGTSTGAPNVWGDGSITINWMRPVDNGGGNISNYRLFMESPDGNVTQVLLNPSDVVAIDQSATYTDVVGDQLQYRYTMNYLDEGEVYLFQIAAVNARGRSGLSSPLAVVCAERPGGSISQNISTGGGPYGVNTSFSSNATTAFNYGLIKPTVVDVSATSIDIVWDEPLDRGVSPITGYEVWMYPGAPLNTQADPEPVKQEIQVIRTVVDTPASEVQVLTITDARNGGQFRLRIRADSNVGGFVDSTTDLITLGRCNSTCLEDALFDAAGDVIGNVTVTGPVVVNSSQAYTITFDNYVGPLTALALESHDLEDRSAYATWYSSVVRSVKGTEPVRGTFTVKFRGYETSALPYDISGYELERELNNLESIDMVSVSRIKSYNIGEDDHYGAYEWSITFVNVMGDVPLLYPSPGRLTCSAETAECVGIEAETVQPGTDAVLVYDGSHAPHVRSFTAKDLITDALYSFKVVPINAVGRGLPSAATATVSARIGASASQTTVRGGAVSVGMAGVVHETQVVTAYNTDGRFSLTLGSWYGESYPINALLTSNPGWDFSSTRNLLNDPNDDKVVSSAGAVKAALEAPGTGITNVHVTRSAAPSYAGLSGVSWTITFLEPLGNVPTLRVNSTNTTTGMVKAVELLAGASNEFIIEPKKASGAPVKDITARSNFGAFDPVDRAGSDIFYTELWKSPVGVVDGTHEWDSDGGVASYSPVLYEIQRLYIPGGTTGGFRLKFDQTENFKSKKDEVCDYISGDFGVGMKEAPSSYDGTTYLGGGDEGSFGYECRGHHTGGWGAPRLGGESYTTENITVNSSALTVKLALEELPNIEAVDVTYEVNPDDQSMTYLVTFTHDLGDLPLLQYVAPEGTATSTGNPLSTYINISEVQEGVTEVQTVTTDADIGFVREIQTLRVGVSSGVVGGFFNVTLPGADKWVKVAYDAEATAVDSLGNGTSVQELLQSLSNIGRVGVSRKVVKAYANDTSSSHYQWSVTFYDPVGDVPDLVVQTNGLTGKQPYVDVNEVTKGSSPLGGTFVLSYGSDFTDDIDFDASNETVKAALEALASIDEVNVRREDLGTGHRWEVTFTKALGNLPDMVAHMHRYEIQYIRTLGGDPTPLGGSFAMRYGGASTQQLPYDASAAAMKLALESLPTIDRVDVARDVYDFGQYQWRVTFRSEIGNIPMMVIDTRLLTGSDARGTVSEHVAGDGASLTGSTPFVRVAEKTAGLPSYTAMYSPNATGSYTLAVRQLTKGGLSGAYFDNQWLLGSPSIERIDPAINFDWGTGPITKFGRDFVSARWHGKLMPPTSELYTIYMTADDGARLWIDHELVIDTWESNSFVSGAARTFVNLTAGHYHDIRIEYKEEVGKASLKLEWQSLSIFRTIIPSSAYYYATQVSGSPYDLTVMPGASDYPYTSASGDGLSHAIAGEVATFIIQTRDENGNPRTDDEAAIDTDFLNISIYRHNRQLGQRAYLDEAGVSGSHVNGHLTGFYGSTDHAPSTMGKPEYIGDGQYKVSYTILKSGYYKLHITSGGSDIECGRGSNYACSPFTLFVDPGPTVAVTTEAEGALSPLMDGLTEAAAGDMGYFFIQAKDTYGNNRIVGGDDIKAMLTFDADPFGKSSSMISRNPIQYRGHVVDHTNGTYLVTYTVPRAGTYKVHLTVNNRQRLNSCTPPVNRPEFLKRQYTGLRVYHAPETCNVEATTLLVVHGPLQASATTAVDTETLGLTYAVVGVENTFTIESRDEFGNLRRGDGTNHFGGYGDGQTDPFSIDFVGPHGYTYKTSSAVMTISCNDSNADGFFRVEFDGEKSLDLTLDTSASALESAIYNMHPGDPHRVRVSKEYTGGLNGNNTFYWSVTFISHLDRWAEVPLSVVPPSYYYDNVTSLDAYNTLEVAIDASRGLYPCAYVLWYKGSYFMSVKHYNGEHIEGSPFSIEVDDGETEAATSYANGQGLVGGVAGEQLSFTIQARDVRQREVQAISINATVVPVVPERQTLTFNTNGAVTLTFRGETTASIAVGSTWAQVEAALEALTTIDDVELDTLNSSSSKTLTASTSVDVLFVGSQVKGDVPLIKSNNKTVTAHEDRKGDAPFVYEVQTLTCQLNGDDDIGSFNIYAPLASGVGSGGFRGISNGGYLTVTSNQTVAEFESFLSEGLDTLVTVRVSGASDYETGLTLPMCSVGGTKLFLEFTEARGDLPALRVNATDMGYNGSITMEHGGVGGSVDGVHPVWGSFTLKFKGAETRPLPFDATPTEMEQALERLPTIGGVTVEHWTPGRRVDNHGDDFSLDSTGLSDMWIVRFDGTCSNATNDWAECPEHIGDEPMMVGNASSLHYHKSSHIHQAKPQLTIIETTPGSAGNNRNYGDDGQNIEDNANDFVRIGVKMIHETRVATPDSGEYQGGKLELPISIGNYEIQALECASHDLMGTFQLYFLGEVIELNANMTLAEVQSTMHDSVYALNRAAGRFLHPPSGGHSADYGFNESWSSALTIEAADGEQKTICAHDNPSPILLNFIGLAVNRVNPYETTAFGALEKDGDVSLNYGTLPEINATSTYKCEVKTYEVTKGLDSMSYLGDGLYEVKYTPTVKGRYDMVVTIDGVEISTDLIEGVWVTPAPASASFIEHFYDSVAVEGIPEHFLIQSRDRFDNDLDGLARGLYTVTLEGEAGSRSSGFMTSGELNFGALSGSDDDIVNSEDWGQDGLLGHVIERPTVKPRQPNSDGIYEVEWMPRVAGSYVFNANYTDYGGLLATYFRMPDLINGAVRSDAAGVEFTYPYHTPPHCPTTQLDAEFGYCDSTRLDPTISFNWGQDAPILVLDHDAHGRGHHDGRDGRTTHPYGANFPTDYWSANWQGFIAPPSTSSNIAFKLVADDDCDASLTVNGMEICSMSSTDLDTPGICIGNWSASSTKSKRIVNGIELYDILVTYSERTGDAKLELLWSVDGGDYVTIPSESLYYTRHIERSPYRFLVYPGEVEPRTSSAYGDGLTECTTMTTCGFTIQARDTQANQRFNRGDNEWLLTLTGVEDWAAQGRVDDVVYLYTDEKQYYAKERRWRGVNTVATTYEPSQGPNDWQLLGNVTAVEGLKYLNVSQASNLTMLVIRGSTIIVGNETLTVSKDQSELLSENIIPLADPFRQSTGSYELWLGGDKTGTYEVRYHPTVRGEYRLDVQLPAISEIQVIESFVDPGSGLGGNFTLKFDALNKLSGLEESEETGPIPFNATAEQVTQALSELSNVDIVSVSKENCAIPTKKCKWIVTFNRIRFEGGIDTEISEESYLSGELFFPTLRPNIFGLKGNNASIAVTVTKQGRAPQHIHGSPFYVHVATNNTDPASSTAYGKGLYEGIAGDISVFRTQSKDRKGNDRTNDQVHDDWMVVPFIPESTYDEFESSQPPFINPNNNQQGNSIEQGGSVRYVDGGAYEFEFTPTRSGDYTIAILAATEYEHQRITTSFFSEKPSQREGSFKLRLRQTGEGYMSGNGNADSLHIPETALYESKLLSWDVSAEAVKEAIEEMGGIGGEVEVTRSELFHNQESSQYEYAIRENPYEPFGRGSNFGYTYDIYFKNYVGDLPLLVPIFADTLVGGVVNVTEVSPGQCEHIMTKYDPLVSETQVIMVTGEDDVDGTFAINFRGHATSDLPWDATADQVKNALEALLPIGSVDVERNSSTNAVIDSLTSSSATNGFEWSITFKPEEKCNRRHALNYGDLPSFTVSSMLTKGNVTVYADSEVSPNGVTTVNGHSPWSESAKIVAAAVSPIHSTAVNSPNSFGLQGLRSGTYNSTSSFIIESRDRFKNRVFVGPLKEVQIVTTMCGMPCNLAGTWTLGFRGHSVEVEAGVGIAALESSLESLDTIGAVTVTTYGVHDPVGNYTDGSTATVKVVMTDHDIYPSGDLSSYLAVGDWVRLDTDDGFVYSIVSMKSTSPYTIRLNKPYEGLSNENANIYRQDTKANVGGYQYIVTFDSNTGDLPSFVINGTGLVAGAGGNKTAAEVTACDWYRRQTISTYADSKLNGTFYLEYAGERTRDLPVFANSSEIQHELNSLDTIYRCSVEPASVGQFGERRWTVNLGSVSTDDFEPIFAEGHLLRGLNARIEVEHDCSTNGRGKFPHHCNTTKTGDGGSFRVHGCQVQSVAGRLGSEYRVALSGPSYVAGNADHIGQGLYKGSFMTPRVGTYDLAVSEAACCGLSASLFNNRWLLGEPVLSRVDPKVDFVWSANDLISPTGKDYVSIRWVGFIRPAFSEELELILEINDGVRLFLDGMLLIDAFEDRVDEDESSSSSANDDEMPPFNTYHASSATSLVADQLYEVKLEFRESTGGAVARLLWQSDSQPLEVVPSHRLFYSSSSIKESPFSISPIPIEPLPVVDVELEVAAWDSLDVTWKAPWNDGGSEVDGFLVEWWSAIDGDYGDKEEQTIKIADSVDGGDWKLGSPRGGAVFHSPLDWNVSSEVLEAALETFSDIGDVTVQYSEDSSKGTRNYHITFETDLGNISSLIIDGRGLTASDGSGVTTSVVCAHGHTSTLCAHNDSVAGTAAILGSTTDINMDIDDNGIYEYRIAGLLQTSEYDDGFSVRVTAHTAAGYGIASPPETLKPVAVPDPPGSAEMFIVPGSDDSLRIHWTESSTDPSLPSGLEFGDRCAEVDAYLVEWDMSRDFNSYSSSASNPNKMISNAYGSILRQPKYFTSDRIANATDAEWFSYVIPNLEPGVPIYTRVTSRNRVGLGNPRYANEMSSLIPRTAPTQIEFGTGVVLSTVPAGGNSGSGHGAGVTVGESTSSLLVQFVPTPDERGAEVLDYLVEWWRSDDDGQREVQVIRTDASADIHGTFTISYDGEQTDSLSYDIEEEAMELALEGLSTIRDVEVTRSMNNHSYGYEWSVTFKTEEPFVDNLALIINGDGLITLNSTNASTVTAQVGKNLISGLAGWHGDVTLDVVQGSDRVTVNGAAVGPSTIEVGDYVRIIESSGTTHIHQVVTLSANKVTWVLSTPYTGSTATIANCDYGVTVPGRRPRGLTSATVAAFDTDRVGRASYTITGLNVDVSYSVRVSSRNARGYSAPQYSNPLSLAPPLQKPGRPNNVKLVGDSDRSLRVLFNAPDDDGGVTITKYKIEWDTSPSFSSGVGGGVLGSHHMVLASPVGACGLTPCDYTISGLTKGTPYYVRVFSYNKFGFSEDPTISYPAVETPCTYAQPPSQVTVNPTVVNGQDGLKVNFLPSADDGGCPVTRYKVEWDPAGALGYQHGAESSTSLLYASNEVQVITMSSVKNDLSGYFRVALDDMFASDPIKVGCSANELSDALNELATVGGIRATRTHLNTAGNYGWAYTVTFKGHGGGRRWVGDVAPLRVSTNTSDYPSEFTQTATAGSLIGSGPPTITTQTAVDGARGFEQQEVKLWASDGGLRGTFRVGWSGTNQFTGANQATAAVYSAPLAWNASAQEVSDALNSVGTGSVRVARELDNSASEITSVNSREQVTSGLGAWDGEDAGIRYVVVFEGATKSGGLPLISLDASSLRSTYYNATVKHNVSTLVVGETPTLNSALKGQAILAVTGSGGVSAEVAGVYDAPNEFYDESKSDLDDGVITEAAVKSGSSFVKTITGLVSGEAYHVRVSAWNGFGNAYGDPAYATPTSKHGLEKYGVR